MDQGDAVLMRQQRKINEVIANDVLSISSNSSICSDFCGFKEFQDIEMPLKHKSRYLENFKEFSIDALPNIGENSAEGRNFTADQPGTAATSANNAKKRFFVSEMELLPAEEIFEVTSNSTTDTIRRQRLERNEELRLKETFLVSRNPIKKMLINNTFQKLRAAEENSESSSEFPASSPSNTQMQKKPPQSQRPPMLKNTLPADAFERGLALIAAQNPPMTVGDKVGTWQCETIDQLSDVEDVISFEEYFKSRECSTKRLPTRSKTAVAYTTFAEFHKRIASVRAPETNLRGNDSKQKSKFTSEDDEKPTTSNCLVRSRDTPLKKRPSKYKRAAETLNEAHVPKKKSSSSGTPKQHATLPNAKKRVQQHKLAATAAGDDAVKMCAAESSATSSHQAQTKGNSKSSSARNTRQVRANKQQTKYPNETTQTAINSNLRKPNNGLTTTPTKEDQDAFFRWRRLSREIDKTSQLKVEKSAAVSTSTSPKPTGLIQIRYDFMGSNESTKQAQETSSKSNAYNVVVKTLKVVEHQNPKGDKNDLIFKTPLQPQQKSKEINYMHTSTSSQRCLAASKNASTIEASKTLVDNEQPSACDPKTTLKSIDDDIKKKNSNPDFDFTLDFHQQHEFCNYLGLTGMSTANAMATAAEELSKCNIARRSLRVRKIEIQKAKVSKQKVTPKKARTDETKTCIALENDQSFANSIVKKENQSENNLSNEAMENGSPAAASICAENLEAKPLLQVNDKQQLNNIATTLTPSEQLMQQTKEREAKIQILCQITASSKQEEEEACKKCVEQITEPIRRTLLEQCKQSGDGPPKTATSKVKMETSASKRLLSAISSSAPPPPLPKPQLPPPTATLLQPLAEAVCEPANHTNAITSDEVTKFIELTPKTSSEKVIENGKTEMQTLHEKVQRCLEESRQSTPNIFIVKSLDSLKDNKTSEANTDQPLTGVEEKTEIETPNNLLFEDVFELEDEEADDEDNVEESTELPLANMRHKAAKVRNNNKATQVTTAAEAAKEKKRKTRNSGIRKANSTISGTRRLYTRSMLNLNQQRELRNRKVILKLLKTYSGLRIKVSQPKKKTTTNAKTIADAVKNASAPVAAAVTTAINKKKNRGGGPHASKRETSIELAVSSEDASVGDKKSAPVTTLFVNKLSDLSSTNAIRNTSSLCAELLSTTNEEEVVDTTNDISEEKQSQSGGETKTIFEFESENMMAASSRTLTPKFMSSAGNFYPFNHRGPKDNLADVAVQTDLANVKTILKPLSYADLAGSPADLQSQPFNKKIRDNNETDVVSSSDVVTSTTTHIGDQNRGAALNETLKPKQLVTKELYRNLSFTAESNVTADAIPSQTSTASHLFTEMNPLANISPNSSAVNINDLGIHALSEPSRALRNPLKTSDGSVLYMYYEEGLLIVVQEVLISFWKYSRILNALTVKLHETKVTESCNSHDLSTENLQSSAATMGFRSSDLEHMSSMLLSGCEWFYLGERKRLTNDIEIESPFMRRLCFSDSRPVYVEMRCRELLNDFRECNLLSCYVNVYFFNEEEQVPCFHSIQLDSIQSAPTDVIYTTIFDSRYFVLAWPQANVLGKVRSGVCKYALTPELDMLATTRDFKAMRHALRSLECLKDGKLLGFGDSQLTVWDHRSGDVLMNYDLSMPLGRNLGTIYYQGLEDGQDNVVIMLQHVRTEASSDLVVIACTISHISPSRRVLQRHRMPTPAFYNISRGVNNGEHFVITAETDEEIWINCNDPRQLIFIPAQRSQRFYSNNRPTLVELTNQTLTVDSFSNYLLKISAGIGSCKKKLPTLKTVPAEDADNEGENVDNKTSWAY